MAPTLCLALAVSLAQMETAAEQFRAPQGSPAKMPLHAILARTAFLLRVMRGAAGITWVVHKFLLGELRTMWFTEPAHRVALKLMAHKSSEKMMEMVKDEPNKYVSGVVTSWKLL